MQRVTRKKQIGKRGITLIEVVVVLGIIGLLSALLIPAVQQTRQSARGVECKSHLHQIGIAAHNYVDQHGRFPDDNFPRQLLPFLEQQQLAERIDKGVKELQMNPPQVAEIRLFAGAAIPTYQCPVDPVASQVRGLVPSYLINSGTGFANSNDGMYTRTASNALVGVRPAQISDGMSQTVAFSERLIPLGRDSYDRLDNPVGRRRLFGFTDPMRAATQIDVFADACRDHPVWVPTYPPPCYVTMGCDPSVNHIMTPNSNSCYNGVGDGAGLYAAVTASSLHRGGVHSLTADGSVHFINENIDRSVWRALGTRARGEPDASRSFE